MGSCGLPIVCSPLGTELIRFVRVVQILHFCLISLKYSLKTLAFHVLDCYVGIGHVHSQENEDTADEKTGYGVRVDRVEVLGQALAYQDVKQTVEDLE